jgi:hypothetical protein
MDQGEVPVSATDIVADDPSHRLALPEIAAVGAEFIVTTALPDTVPVQLTSLTAVSEYVVVPEGVTVNTNGEVSVLFTVTGVVPSV